MDVRIQRLKVRIKASSTVTKTIRNLARAELNKARKLSKQFTDEDQEWGPYIQEMRWNALRLRDSVSKQSNAYKEVVPHRYLLLAYGYLRGHTYHQIEQTCREAPDVSKVAGLLGAYDHSKHQASVKQWIEDGELTRWDIEPHKKKEAV